MHGDWMQYSIPRAAIETMDTAALLRDFDADSPDTLRLRECFGRVTFRLEGYDAHPDALHLIPDLRRFVRQWHELSPHWLYFGSLGDPWLGILYLALMETADMVSIGEAGLGRVRFQTGELVTLLAGDLTHADEVAFRAGFDLETRRQRAGGILRYFRHLGGL